MAPKKALSQKRRSKRKGIRYRQVNFKLTDYQKKALERYCKANGLTPIRFMKALINSHVERYRDQTPSTSYVTENQLELFGEDNSL